MTRKSVRELKRGLRRAGDSGDRDVAASTALALLDRSMAFGHSRLALIRLAEAVSAGSPLLDRHWEYCAEAARRTDDRALMDVYRLAANQRQHRSCLNAQEA